MRRRGREPERERALTAAPRHAPLGVRLVLGTDVALSAASGVLAALALAGTVPDGGLPRWALVAAVPIAVVRSLLSLRASRLVGNATVWRRRLGFLDLLAALGLAAIPPHAKAAVVVWTGVVWIACIQAAREIAHLYVSETGKEVPSDH
jgi:hypothetical protein